METISPVLVLEPFFGGSHKQLLDLLSEENPGFLDVHSMSAKKWHWRARVSALHFAQSVPMHRHYRTLFASSVLNLSELIALRPDLASLHKVLYFHENQLEYPVRKKQDRDFQYGYNQVISCLVADEVVFNSKYNMESFLGSLTTFFNQTPDYRPKGLESQIRSKSSVLHVPLRLPPIRLVRKEEDTPLHIVWPHRWEHDKNPELFFKVLLQLKESDLKFYVSILGERFSDVPEIFGTSRSKLEEEILNWGYLDSREKYLQVLYEADVVVSTSDHEFFGVAMIEAVACGCYALCPNKLVYPEIFPEEHLYRTENQLLKRLKTFCKHLHLVRQHICQMDITTFSWDKLAKRYKKLLGV